MELNSALGFPAEKLARRNGMMTEKCVPTLLPSTLVGCFAETCGFSSGAQEMQCTASCLQPNLMKKLALSSSWRNWRFPTCPSEKVIHLVANVTDTHILLQAEPRYSKHSSPANMHLLTFPDVPLCLHIRTAGEAVTETPPGMVNHRNGAEAVRSRGNKSQESSIRV